MLKKPTRTALAFKALIEFSDSVLAEDAAFAMSKPHIFRWRSKRFILPDAGRTAQMCQEILRRC